ncbi:uncharacterized protein APUU_10486A [Aspergillus puulaauensis]|uniref:Glycine zipper domain-containing protein n=1 Tax=Aspergillus puulaauensis TaxID=1220207 RepID=A0A7R7XAU5_9EURO|nr:uncharacterized protein APUU_10486A [Aspergillus puulaauensis]BCS17658.1 hypothetical protein APUU_10486A [Aspergillus puulaauensis]
MHFFTTTAVSALAALSLVQFCPAPPAVIGAIAGGLGGGAISGGIAAGTKNSRRDLPAGVSQESIDQCTQQINDQGSPVNVYSTGDSSARADDVPPACMNLAAVLLDNPAQAGGPVPTPMGSASLEYTGLSEDDKTQLQNALSG